MVPGKLLQIAGDDTEAFEVALNEQFAAVLAALGGVGVVSAEHDDAASAEGVSVTVDDVDRVTLEHNDDLGEFVGVEGEGLARAGEEGAGEWEIMFRERGGGSNGGADRHAVLLLCYERVTFILYTCIRVLHD